MSFSPFVNSPHGHPSFNPVKVGKGVSNSELAKNNKQPKPPDKPLMPYMRYSKKVWDEVRARFPDHKIWEISKIVGQMWRDLPEEQKQDYVDAFEAEKIEYNEQLKIYHNSPAYQQWIATLKSKEQEERDSQHKAAAAAAGGGGGPGSGGPGGPSKSKKSMGGGHGGPMSHSPQKGHGHGHGHHHHGGGDGRVSLQVNMDGEEGVAADELADDYYSIKHLSAARFYRNHKLVAEIFDERVLPENRTNPESRYHVLLRQTESLLMHHKTLNDELETIEARFQERKRALLDSSEKFDLEMKKRFAAKPVVDEAAYQRMVERALEQIRRENGELPVQTTVQPTSTSQPPPPAPSATATSETAATEKPAEGSAAASEPAAAEKPPQPAEQQQQQ
ncbi:PREDICTED: SWI/SNF-related matrix-associated actin-dependent regulator of chromatin subfamily E member 1-like [Rhagoletis zephyria]|uniref:SWI/SNF-related matrix-associated actin-dependent regulator of chromatin subfamily E member 1-like n=1 Tax=Rhagoletis zephyria TaxID=28612 RepID=UPI0008119F55|nr:PREDICTED: SWI/SNF-related matrix-associated actin-dependent regulator of chromatin subfamily E member 1-like [Rhagoletis zephyria]